MAEMSYPQGIHVPCLTWFRDNVDQEIDWNLQKLHIEFLIKSVVIAGTNGEAVSLTRDEKCQLVKITREIAKDVEKAGADYVLVLTPSYFHFAMDTKAIIDFFEELARSSPLPILIYNFPGVSAGLDLGSDVLDHLGQNPNIVGVKLTCGGIAKVARISASYPPEQFAALAGQSDWLIPALSVGGTGAITGVANVYPKVCIQIYNLYTSGQLKEAEALQRRLARMEWGFAKGGINGTKWVVAQLKGYPSGSWHCRRPYPKFHDEQQQSWILKVVEPLKELEDSLSGSVNQE
ncbi:dihydrodipicolinate synthase family protein [Aspergillus tanneri]|uniref:4-hydroxy-2-oxoglutarate aldolase, mitochondrial n=1 Tax=Aspergillus tanneri TaxID=1220188 RepID=A0A5M9MBZ1_9EURO|nr:uncharacterized protein ATNIH1004_008632 [Aspergillus tanneri]KAA8644428.1 hypothetical protein ATNIH1004_008632 [Aspergillus tanneri]